MSVNRLDLIIERLDKIIELMEDKKNIEPLTTFIPASDKASDNFIKEREKEIFNSLDNRECEK